MNAAPQGVAQQPASPHRAAVVWAISRPNSGIHGGEPADSVFDMNEWLEKSAGRHVRIENLYRLGRVQFGWADAAGALAAR